MTIRKVMALTFAFALVVAACGDDDDSAGPGDWPDKIVFGFVPSQDQSELQDDIEPFMQVLRDALNIEVEGFVSTDYTGLVVALGSGTADLGSFGPTGYVLAEKEFPNIEVLIQSIRRGTATYHGQWFTDDPSLCGTAPAPGAFENEPVGDPNAAPVLKEPTDVFAQQVGYDYSGDAPVPDEGISEGLACEGVDFSKLAGKTIAFTNETSTSGYIFPALQLIQSGVNLDQVTVIFTGGHDGPVTAVYNGDADIGLGFDDSRRLIRSEKTDVGDKLIVFSITGEIPNDVVAVRAGLPQSLKDAIFKAVSDYLATDAGKAVFDEIYEWTDIRRAVDSDFDIVRAAVDELNLTE